MPAFTVGLAEICAIGAAGASARALSSGLGEIEGAGVAMGGVGVGIAPAASARKGRRIYGFGLWQRCAIGTRPALVAISGALEHREIIFPSTARQSDKTRSFKAKGLGEAFCLLKRFLCNRRDGLPLGCKETIHAEFVKLIGGLTCQGLLQGFGACVGVIKVHTLNLIGGQRYKNLQRICRLGHHGLAQMRERFGQMFSVW